MSIEIKSGSTSDLMTVDATSKAARMTPYDTEGVTILYGKTDQPSAPKGIMSVGINDEMTVPIRLDRLGSQGTAWHTPLLQESFEGTTINQQRWFVSAALMNYSQSSVSGLTFNTNFLTNPTLGMLVRSTQLFLKNQRSPLQVKFRVRIVPVNNSIIEIGFGNTPSYNGVNTSGAYWRVTANGVLHPVLTFNGLDLTGTDIRSLINTNNYYTFDVFMDDAEATFVCQDTSTGIVINKQTIKLPVTAQRLLSDTQVSFFARLFNSGAAPASAAQMMLTDVYVLALDANMNKTWPQVCAANNRGIPTNPFTGAQLVNWTNSAAPSSATLSNTVAGYTTLGGLFQFVAVAGSNTDYALFGYQVPARSNLVVTGVDIDAWITGAAVATTSTLLVWCASVSSTAVSLVSSTGNRIGIGSQTFPVGAAIGSIAQRISTEFITPLYCPSERFFHIILRIPVATATASQIIQGMVNIQGYFE